MCKTRSIAVGDTYYVLLQQDWTTCVIDAVLPDSVGVDFRGRLHRYGLPIYKEIIPMDHFLAAYEHAPEGHWSRQYDED